MVLLAIIWAAGWFTPPDSFEGNENRILLIAITATVIAAWSLLASVIAAGFFHAASKHSSNTVRGYKFASLRLLIVGIIFLFPGPIMAQVLGMSMTGRALALFITAISISTILFGRARINQIEGRIAVLESGAVEHPLLAPWEETEKRMPPV